MVCHTINKKCFFLSSSHPDIYPVSTTAFFPNINSCCCCCRPRTTIATRPQRLIDNSIREISNPFSYQKTKKQLPQPSTWRSPVSLLPSPPRLPWLLPSPSASPPSWLPSLLVVSFWYMLCLVASLASIPSRSWRLTFKTSWLFCYCFRAAWNPHCQEDKMLTYFAKPPRLSPCSPRWRTSTSPLALSTRPCTSVARPSSPRVRDYYQNFQEFIQLTQCPAERRMNVTFKA